MDYKGEGRDYKGEGMDYKGGNECSLQWAREAMALHLRGVGAEPLHARHKLGALTLLSDAEPACTAAPTRSRCARARSARPLEGCCLDMHVAPRKPARVEVREGFRHTELPELKRAVPPKTIFWLESHAVLSLDKNKETAAPPFPPAPPAFRNAHSLPLKLSQGSFSR